MSRSSSNQFFPFLTPGKIKEILLAQQKLLPRVAEKQNSIKMIIKFKIRK